MVLGMKSGAVSLYSSGDQPAGILDTKEDIVEAPTSNG